MKTFFSIFILHLITITCYCKPLYSFNIRHYSMENGLPNNNITAIIQDEKGFIWIGTGEGLCRFDGVNFRLFPNNCIKNNKANSIVSICTINNKGLMVGTEKGLYIFDYKLESFTPFKYKDQTKNTIQHLSDFVTHLSTDKNNNLWIGTNNGTIHKYSENDNDFITFKPTTSKLPILQIVADNQNNIWASSMDYLYKLNKANNNFEIFEIQDNPSLYSMALHIDEKDYIWIGTWNNGLWKLDTNKHTVEKFFMPHQKDGISHIHSIKKVADNLIYIGSDNGLTIFNTATNESTLYNNSPQSILCANSIYPIYKDKEGGIWIGTYYNGINYIQPCLKSFYGYSYKNDDNHLFKGNIISKFCEDKSGNIWIGSDDGGLSLFSPYQKKFMDFKNRKELQSYNVHGLCIDNDELLIGTYGNGFKKLNLKNGGLTDFPSKGLYDKSVYSIYKDKDNIIWVGTMHGICQYDNNKKEFIPGYRTESLVNTITEENNNLWVCTASNGLFKYDKKNKEWSHYLQDTTLNDIFIDSKNIIWLASSKGLIKYNGKNFNKVKLKLENDNISAIIEDEGYLWLTTSKGLIKYHPLTNNLQYFSKSDGLQSESFTAASALKTKNGEIYIGSINGFNTFYPHQLKLNMQKPHVVLTGLEIFNKNIETQKDGILPEAIDHLQEIHLSHSDNVITLTYAALSYCVPQKNQYAYFLEGFDRGWNYVGSQHSTTYTNLPAGSYTFRVKASNNDNVWNEEGTSIRIIVHPPFYLSLPFKIGYAFLFLLGLGLLIHYVIHRSEKKHAKVINELNDNKEKEIHEAKINFFTMIAHEIRTPVSLIIGPLEKIMQSTNIPANDRQELEIIDRNSQRLLYLVNQLLDFRKVEQKEMKMKFTSQSIMKLMQAVCERFSPTLQQRGINFSATYPDENFYADVDKEALTKVLSNLLTNANKYTKDFIAVNLQKHSQTFSIEVKDNGKGIPEKELKNIFKPFYQASKNKPGTGIGLSIVKGIVEAHNGQIDITSQVGQGVSVTITLPQKQENLSAEEEENQAGNPLPEDIIPEQNATAAMSQKVLPIMLIVDDNEDMLNFLSSHFQTSYTIVTAIDGVDALNKLKEQEVALIISDWMMPNMNGIDLCKAVRNNQLTSHIPFILLTAKTDTEAKITSMNCGADAYIEKPFSLQYLEACIKNLLELRLQLRQKFSQMPTVSINSIAANQSDKVFLEKMNHLIEENLNNEELSVDFLAEKLCISRSGLFVKIKGLANTTPNEMIQIIRLKKAASLLLENQYRINEVSYMVGFNNPSYFSKCFQKQFGMKPGEYIASHAHKAE